LEPIRKENGESLNKEYIPMKLVNEAGTYAGILINQQRVEQFDERLSMVQSTE
jgi:hypothetical protein